MPGRDYTQAYARFEQSLRNSFALPSYDSESDDEGDLHNLQALKAPHAIQMASEQYGNSSEAHVAPKTPPGLTYHNVGLPPTPPSNTRSNKSFPCTNFSLPSYKRNPTTTIQRKDAKNLWTPNATPPESAEVLNVADSGSLPMSPYQESFRTALEDPWTPHMDDQSRYCSVQTLRSTPLQESAEFRELFRNTQKQTPNSSHAGETQTHVLQTKADSDNLNGLSMDHKKNLALSPDFAVSEVGPRVRQAWNDWHKASGGTPAIPYFAIPNPADVESVPSLMRGLSQRNSRRLRRQPSLSDIIGLPSPPSVTAVLVRDFGTVAGQRTSAASHTSSIMRVHVQDRTPQAQTPKLRRSPRCGDLREQASVSDMSRRSSGDSDQTLFHILGYKKQQHPTPEESQNTSLEESTEDKSDQQRPSRQGRDSLGSEPSPNVEMHVLRHKGNLTPQSRPSEPQDDYQNQRILPHVNLESKFEELMQPGRQKSLDNASIETDDLRRPSADHHSTHLHMFSPIKPSSPHSSRHPDLGSTPLSFQSEAASVNEATAVNIYPHHNNSLLVVEHAAAMHPLHQHPVTILQSVDRDSIRRSSYMSVQIPSSMDAGPPAITINTNTANASNSPNPPTFSIIPPTPADSLNVEESLAVLDKSPPGETPTHRTSMLKRARQYSDGILRPIITFTTSNTGSLRRSITVRKHYWNSRPGVADSRHADPSNTHNNLHPFWQPRAFWDGMSDDGSNDDDLVPDEVVDGNLPAGGDTSDDYVDLQTTNHDSTTTPAQPTFNKRRRSGRGGSFRGFLIGNSLGIERGPTNKRRHVVRWPTGRKKKNIAGEMGGSGPKTMQVDPAVKPQNGSLTSLGSTSSALLRISPVTLGPKGMAGIMGAWKRRFIGEKMKW